MVPFSMGLALIYHKHESWLATAFYNLWKGSRDYGMRITQQLIHFIKSHFIASNSCYITCQTLRRRGI